MRPQDRAATSDRRMALAHEWDELVERVRELEGFGGFMRVPDRSRLLPRGCGPVVVLNVSRWRCDAVVVTADDARVVELDITADDVTAVTRRYLDALQRVADDPWDVEGTLDEVLRWLWDEIAGRIVDAIAPTTTPGRLWWYPTGLLTLLPLHAAGHHGPDGRKHGRAVIDRVVSSYAPTLRTLDAPAGPLATGNDSDRRMLVVAVADAPGRAPLAGVARERDLVTRSFPERCTVLESAGATREAVRARLASHAWVHFCCHGDQNLTDPSRGGLSLHDGVLSVTDVAAGRYRGEFAFVSACKSATGGTSLSDETITLTAALHYAGFRHVIGTLWSVYDDTAADIAQGVYTDLCRSGTFEPWRAARALHDAVRRERDAGAPLTAWTPFTHTGP